jgi:sarcosine oxidase
MWWWLGWGAGQRRRLGPGQGRGQVLGLEHLQLGHHRGASHDHARIIRRSYHTPAYVRLTGLAYRAWAELEWETEERLVVATGGLDLFPANSAIPPGAYRSSLEAAASPTSGWTRPR